MQEKVRGKKSESQRDGGCVGGGDLRILVLANKGLYKLKGKREGEVICWRGSGRCVCTVENLEGKN